MQPAATSPLFTARTTVTIVALAIALALGLAYATEAWVAPSLCTAHDQPRGLALLRVESASYRQDSGLGCVYRAADGGETVVPLAEQGRFWADLSLSTAMDLEITIPLLCVLLALGRVGWARLRSD